MAPARLALSPRGEPSRQGPTHRGRSAARHGPAGIQKGGSLGGLSGISTAASESGPPAKRAIQVSGRHSLGVPEREAEGADMWLVGVIRRCPPADRNPCPGSPGGVGFHVSV